MDRKNLFPIGEVSKLFHISVSSLRHYENQTQRKMLIDTFVNAIFLYDDKVVLTYNFHEGAETISFEELQKVTEAGTSGSDLVPSAAPNQNNPNQIFQIGNGFGFFLIFQSQRYNTLDLASKVSMQGAEILRNPCETMIQQSSYRDILLLRNMVYFAQ